MSDPKQPLDLGDFDWDSALDEWEKTSFTPQVAKEAASTQALPDESGAASAPSAPALPAAAGSLSNVSGTGTVIAPVPSELRLPSVPPPPVVTPPSPSPPATRASAPVPATPSARPSAPPPPGRPSGGLSQLFSKSPSVPPPPMPMRGSSPPRLRGSEPPSETTKVASAAQLEELAVSSAWPDAASGEHRAAQDPSSTAPTFDLLAAPSVPSVTKAELEAARGPVSVTESRRPPPLAPADDEPEATIVRESARPEREKPNEESQATIVLDRDRSAPPPAARSGSMSDAETATRLPGENAPQAVRARAVEGPESFEAERPVSRWLDDATTEAFRVRAAWLEEEGRALSDPTDMARALLTVSELQALVGDEARALALAEEARDLAPQIALAWRQARQLAGRDPEVLVAALDAEASSSPTPAARVHATLLAADVLRTSGMGDLAVERWKSACKLDPSDVRAHAALAAVALAQEAYASKAFDLADNSELVPLYRIVATALRMRDHERPEADAVPFPVSDGLRRARSALVAQDGVAAAQALTSIASEPTLSKAALWLASALSAPTIAGRRASARALRSLSNEGDELARRQLAARGIELADGELVQASLGDPDAFDASERVVLSALAGLDTSSHLAALARSDEHGPLVDAVAAITASEGEAAARARAGRVSGTAESRALAQVGRLVAAKLPEEEVDAALGSIARGTSAAQAGVALGLAIRGRRWPELTEALSSLPASGETSWQRHVAAALVAERAGNADDATRAWKEALGEGARHDVVVRAATPRAELAKALTALADELPEGAPSAILRLEALARSEGAGDDERLSILEKIHRAAPQLGIGSFLAERIARRRGNLDEVLRWIHERGSYASTDLLESALEAVREALLIADKDPERASARLEEAHASRPDDVALRELFERLASEPPRDRASWREKRAEKASGTTRAIFLTEAALEHERSGDATSALRTARLAIDGGDVGLAKLVAERAELDLGQMGRASEELRAVAEAEASDAQARREARERLAELDAFGRKDVDAALAWHRAILEDEPRWMPSLRYVEHELVSSGRHEELARVAEQIGLALDGTAGGEVTAHAQLAARIKARDGGWERTADMARLAATQPEASLWSIRALNAHARLQRDDPGELSTTLTLLERTQRPAERATLLLRASEACARLERVEEAARYLEQAATEDPGDVVTWGFLAEVRARAGDTKGAAEACESLARTSGVPEHQLLAWYDAARIWLEEAKDAEKGMSALEQAAELDVGYADVFTRLSGLYAERQLDAELARLLEKRLESALDDNERVVLEVELSRALADMGELGRAKDCLERALANQPDHTSALAALAEVCTKEGDWPGAESAYVRLARLSPDPADQRAIYEKLAEIYSVHAPNFSRAEVALKEVLKRAPADVTAHEKLVEVYKRQGDLPRAIETQQALVAVSTDSSERLKRQIELAGIFENAGRDLRKAEQALEAARKEFPTSVVALRALAEFYGRQRQMPAMQILLDRAASDARRSFAAGRFVPSLFEVLHAAYDLRGRKDSAKVVAATLAAVEGQPATLGGADARAVDPQLDDVLAPDLVSFPLRTLLAHAGDALDAVAPMDLRALRAAPLHPGSPLATSIGAVATAVGLAMLQVYVSPTVGRTAIPLASNPPTLLVGEALGEPGNDRARTFLITRAIKMILARSSGLLRGKPDEVAVLLNALFTAFNPTYAPQGGVDPRKVADLARRIQQVLPRNLDPTVGVIALESAGMLGPQSTSIGPAATAWANHVGLLAVGDPNAALDGIAWARGEAGAPKGSEERGSWIARTAEARELMTFSVTDAYSEARARLRIG